MSTECHCRYRYSGTSWPNMIMPPWFLDITDAVSFGELRREWRDRMLITIVDMIGSIGPIGWHLKCLLTYRRTMALSIHIS